MSPINIPRNDFGELRKKAEDNLPKKERKTKSSKIFNYEHELSVYEIELKLQNEELLEVQAKLEDTINHYSELFEYAPIGYFILDKEGVIVNVNDKGSSKLNIHKKQLIGKPFSTFLVGEICQDDFYRHRNLTFESGRTQRFEAQIKRKDGSLFFALIESTIVKDKNGDFKHFHSMVSDISDRIEQEKKIEFALMKAKELNELKSRFITTASHEFRTPLTAILSSTSLLEKYTNQQDSEKRDKHFNRIKTSVNVLKEILSEFLSLSQIEKDMIKNSPETINIIKFIEGLIEEINNETHVITFTHLGKHQHALVDPRLLKICMINLIGNAIKYSAIGTRVEIRTEQKNDNSLVILVKDEGIGIPEKDIPHIFEQFFRAKNVENFQGTGLGLNIIHKLITIMGGTIGFKTKENEGTVFSIKLFKK